jgi:molybdenum cofactor cytidylyltransferase
MGFGQTGEIVAVHTDLAGGNLQLSLEAKLVYLADKLVAGDKLVTLEERYDPRNRPWQPTPESLAAIAGRYKVACTVKAEMENLVGQPLENILRS